MRSWQIGGGVLALVGGALGAAGLLLGSSLQSQASGKATSASYAAFREKLAPADRLTHALDRLTFGAKPGDKERLRQQGLQAWLNDQLYPERTPENPNLNQRLASLSSLNQSPSALAAELQSGSAAGNLAAGGPVRRGKEIVGELSEAKLLCATYGNHQLAELLDDFWFNHFNVFAGKGLDRLFLAAYERDVIRPHIFSTFYDLLLATAQSPAMLFYLDNWQSVGSDQPVRVRKARRGLNENYGRELLELHTLGVNGGYTQDDVIAVARCFTGWTIEAPRRGGGFIYNDKLHDKGEKIVLGHVISAGGGLNDGLQVLALLAASPVTAHHISYQLAQRFVADDPPPSLVDRMTKTFEKTGGDLRAVTRMMITAPEFWSRGAFDAKIKSPFELLVSALRATDADVSSATALMGELQKLGEPLYRKIEPTGYSNANGEWVSSAGLLERLNLSLALARNHLNGVDVPCARWSQDARVDTVGLSQSVLGRNLDDQTSSAIRRALLSSESESQREQGAESSAAAKAGLVVALTLGSPEFQHH